MDSKNVIWLSSFFALLFITFCVTRHLDDLNPTILNISTYTDTEKMDNELSSINIENDYQNFGVPKIETPKIETPKIETPKIETPKIETPKIETPEVIATDDMPTIVPSIPEVPKVIAKPAPVKKVLKKVTKKKEKILITHKQSKKKKTKAYTIDNHSLEAREIEKILNGSNDNNLNRLAYKATIHKNANITIKTKNIHAAKYLKQYFIKHNVHAKHIKIMRNSSIFNDVDITLTGRK